MSPRPFTRRLASRVRDVLALPASDGVEGGSFAVLGNGVTLLDRSLATLGAIAPPPDDLRGSHLLRAGDGRFAVCERSFGSLVVGRVGGALAIGEGYFDSVAATSAGFVATSLDKALLDAGDAPRALELAPGYVGKGVVAWGDGALVAGHEGFVVLDANGAVTRTIELALADVPVTLGPSAIALPGWDDVHVFDGAGLRVAIPGRKPSTALTPFQGGLLEVEDQAVRLWRWPTAPGSEQEPEQVWQWTAPEPLRSVRSPIVIGDAIVIGAWDVATAWILDATGALLEAVPLTGTLHGAHRFGDGLVLHAAGAPSLAWWGRDREARTLEHDGEPSVVRAVGDMLVTSEGDLLHLWRTDADGPEVPLLAPGRLPFGVPLVVGGQVVTLEEGGRWAYRARGASSGGLVLVSPEATFRPAKTRDEATAIVQAQVAARQDALPEGILMEELSAALGTSARRLGAALRARQYPLEPPRAIEGYEYVGMFTTSGALRIADPCYLHKRSKPAFPLTHDVKALDGRWYAFIRPGVLGARDRSAELVVVHADGFGVVASELIANVGVDSGTAGVFDRALPERKEDDPPYEEGIVSGRGALSWSGYGDGYYPVFAGEARGAVAKLRIVFLGPTPPELDGTAVRTGGAGAGAATPRRYAATDTFAVGDLIEHKKFGAGTVIRVLARDKIEVSFGGEPRVLVQGLPA